MTTPLLLDVALKTRDLFDWLDLAFTVSTGVVIALAALLAYAVQRARYPKDIAPDVRFDMPPIVSSTTLAGTFDLQCDLVLYGEGGGADKVTITGRVRFGNMTRWADTSGSTGEVATGQSVRIDLSFGSQQMTEAFQTVEGDDHDVEAIINLKAYTPMELVLLLIHPWGLARKMYNRKYSVAWKWHWTDDHWAAMSPRMKSI